MLSAFSEEHVLFGSGLWLQRGTRTILLVDDDAAVLQILSDVLVDAGYKVLACSSADVAMESFERNGSVDLLLADFLMPERTGVELATALTSLASGVQVLIFSAAAMDEMVLWELWRKGWIVLPKPTTLAVLLKTVDYQCGLFPVDDALIKVAC